MPFLYAKANGAKTATSNDCKMYVVYSSKHKRMIFKAIANKIAAVVTCDACPSKIKILYANSLWSC
jgi:ribosomal protein L37AE/L43A